MCEETNRRWIFERHSNVCERSMKWGIVIDKTTHMWVYSIPKRYRSHIERNASYCCSVNRIHVNWRVLTNVLFCIVQQRLLSLRRPQIDEIRCAKRERVYYVFVCNHLSTKRVIWFILRDIQDFSCTSESWYYSKKIVFIGFFPPKTMGQFLCNSIMI